MEGIKLVLVVTTYNAENVCEEFVLWLKECYQLFFWVVIVDDCSSDGSYQYLRISLSFMENLSLIRLDSNTGRPATPRNVGLKQVADADRFVFLDIDDRLTQDYLAFLSSVEAGGSQNIYSGVKLPLNTLLFDASYKSDFTKTRRVNRSALRFKNHIVLSGSSIPASIALTHEFECRPLEDWLFWRAIAEDRSHSGFFCRLLDVPIGYDVTPSLSPAKRKQVSRVRRHLSGVGLLRYFAGSARLRLEEFKLKARLRWARQRATTEFLSEIGN